MVDYKLIIDIDEHELVKKLNRALAKVQMGGSGSSGGQSGGYVASIMGGMGGIPQSGPGATLTEGGMKRVQEAAEKRGIYERSKMNLLTFEAQKKVEFQKQKHGDRMEAMGKMQHKMQSRMFTTGSIVKLAGLASGVAGLIQMRKMVIDSSPMLQAMLKVLNIGIMFILRPIGDFFGFVFRPIFIPFVQWAVKFYASTLKYIPAWDKLGQAIFHVLTGEFAEATKFYAAYKAEISKVGAIEELKDQLKEFALTDEDTPGVITAEEKETSNLILRAESAWWDAKIKAILDKEVTLWDGLAVIMDVVTTPLQINNKLLGDMATKLWELITAGDAAGLMLAGLFTLPKANPPAYACVPTDPLTGKPYLGPGYGTGECSKTPEEIGDTRITGEIGAGGTAHEVELEENIGFSDDIKAGINHFIEFTEKLGFTGATEEEKKGPPYSDELLDIMRRMEEEGFGDKASKLKTDYLASEAAIVNAKMGVMSPAGSEGEGGNFAKYGFLSGGFTATKEDAAATQIELESAEAQREILDKNQRNTDSIDEKIGKLQDQLEMELDAIHAQAGMFEDGSARVTVTNFNELTGGPATGGATGSGGSSGSGGFGGSSGPTGWKASNGKVYSSESEAIQNSNPTIVKKIGGVNTQVPNPDYKPPTEVNAMGGVITEEIQGIGKRTGKRYSFGEQGDEAIIPINQFYEMAARLKRIGAGGTIPSSLQNEGVGMFTGVTAFGLNRSLDKYNAARDLKDTNAGGLQDRLAALREQASSMQKPFTKYGNIDSRQNTLRRMLYKDKQSALQLQIAPLQKELSALMSGEESARTEFGDLFQQAGGTTEGGTTNNSTTNNSINISVSDSSGNIDNIIQKIGPKLLKYLQENESRIGIR